MKNYYSFILVLILFLLSGFDSYAASYADILESAEVEPEYMVSTMSVSNYDEYLMTPVYDPPADWFVIEKSEDIAYTYSTYLDQGNAHYCNRFQSSPLDISGYNGVYQYVGIMMDVTIKTDLVYCDYAIFRNESSSIDYGNRLFLEILGGFQYNNTSASNCYTYVLSEEEAPVGSRVKIYMYFTDLPADVVSLKSGSYYGSYQQLQSTPDFAISFGNAGDSIPASGFEVHSLKLFGANTIEEPYTGPSPEENLQTIADALTGENEASDKMNEQNTVLSDSLTELEDIENQITDDTRDTLNNFNFADHANIFGTFFPQEFMYLGNLINDYINASSAWSTVLVFSLTVALISVVIGVFNYTKQIRHREDD